MSISFFSDSSLEKSLEEIWSREEEIWRAGSFRGMFEDPSNGIYSPGLVFAGRSRDTEEILRGCLFTLRVFCLSIRGRTLSPLPPPPRDESWRTKREGGSRNEKAGNYNPVRLFFFLQTEDESREGSRSKWDVWNVSRKIFPSPLLPEKVRQFYASKIDGEIAGKRIWRISLYMIDLCFNKRILENIAIKNSKRDSIFLFFSKWKRTYIWTVYH